MSASKRDLINSTSHLAVVEEDVLLAVRTALDPDPDPMDLEAVRPLHAGSSVSATHAIRFNPTPDVVMDLDLEDQQGVIVDTETIVRHGMDLLAELRPRRILVPIALRVDLVSRFRLLRIRRPLDYLLDQECLLRDKEERIDRLVGTDLDLADLVLQQ